MSTNDSHLPKRRSPRLPDYDYTSNGAYFVTICTHHRFQLLGKITNQTMMLNEAGKMVNAYLDQLPEQFASVDRDLHVVMPNHLHMLIMKTHHDDVTLSQIIQWFKRVTTNRYIEGVKHRGWPRFYTRLWQQSFHDHIIRDEQSLKQIREYILYNPRLWEKDIFYGK